MKAFGILGSLLVLGLIVEAGRLGPVPAYAHETMTTVEAQTSQHVAANDQDAKTFTGKITEVNGQFVLQDATNKATYQLDDQDKAKQYNGQEVKVTGTLDTATNTIHVTEIQPA